MKKLFLIFIVVFLLSCKKNDTTSVSSGGSGAGNTGATGHYKVISFSATQYFATPQIDTNTINSYYSLNGIKHYISPRPFINMLPSPIYDSVTHVKTGDVFELYIEMTQPCNGLGLSINQYWSDSTFASGYPSNGYLFAAMDSVFHPLGSPAGTSGKLTYTVK